MNRAEFLDLATDYLNERLNPEERAAFHAYLNEHPAAQQDLNNLGHIRNNLATQTAAETAVAWTAMQAQLNAEKSPSGLAARWRKWRMKLGLFIAIAVAAIEAMLLMNAPVYRQAPVDSEIKNISVIFAPNVQQKAMRDLLDHLHAQITAGPGPSGEFVLSIAAEEMESALIKLRASPVVEDAYTPKARP